MSLGLGIAFGSASLIAVLAIGRGGELRVEYELSDIGIRRIWLFPDASEYKPFSQEDAVFTSEQFSQQALVMADSSKSAAATYGGKTANVLLYGCQSQLPVMEKIDFVSGHFFTTYDDENNPPLIVIDTVLSHNLFGPSPSLGKQLDIDGHACTIIGVVEKRTSRGEDGMAYIPLGTFQNWFRPGMVDEINIMPNEEENLKAIEFSARQLLSGRTGLDVKSTTLESEREIANNILNIFRWVIGSVAVVALLVGGVGIMNVMYMTIHSRVREIGIRKALGARDCHIMLQFLLESTILSLAGGAAESLIGVFLSFLSSKMDVTGTAIRRRDTDGRSLQRHHQWRRIAARSFRTAVQASAVARGNNCLSPPAG
jgi:putative ABC transport system permease protein